MIKFFSLQKNKIEEIPQGKINLRSKNPIWVEMQSPTPEEINSIKETFEIHPTTEEDILSGQTRIKYEEFEENTFIIFKGINNISPLETNTYNMSFLVGERFIITSHQEKNETTEYLLSNPKKTESLLKKGKEYLLHYILDKEVDKHMRIKSGLLEEFKKIEKKFTQNPGKQVLGEIFEIEMILLENRQIMESLTDMLLNLTKPTDNYIDNEIIPYFRDIYDHSFKTNESLKSMIGRINGMRNSYQSIISNKINETMRTLTIIMAVMMPMTIITGFYGMNISLPFQENTNIWIPLASIMFGIALLMFLIFRRVDSKKIR